MQLETQEADFNIRSIFHRQHGHPDHISCPDGIEPVYRNCPPLKSLLVNRQHSSDSESSVSSLELAASRRNIQVNGGDIGDLPAQYNVQGLRLNEVPVIGINLYNFFSFLFLRCACQSGNTVNVVLFKLTSSHLQDNIVRHCCRQFAFLAGC